MPVKVVNGAVVFMRDVAYVHDGSPPQTNVVQLDGRKGVLMSVLKIGSASTLDIISGIKERLPAIQATLRPASRSNSSRDQSGFVKSSVAAVVREGLIAAALTGFMILVFLGSWRSTLIITVSIPLAVLSSLIALSLLGQTINVMTLGGLALAVGILVDDATVTIENINRHMEEHGEDILTAITHGAQEIMPPATVALVLHLHRLRASALARRRRRLSLPAAGDGGRLRDDRLLHPDLYARADDGAFSAAQSASSSRAARDESGEPPPAGFFGRFQQRFEHHFERLRQGYMVCCNWRCAPASGLPAASSASRLLSLGLAPFLGQDFFPSVDAGAIKIHMRAPTGTRIEETTRLADQVEQKIRTIIPPDRLASIVDNIGLPISGINISYRNSGTIGVFDADILVTLERRGDPD